MTRPKDLPAWILVDKYNALLSEVLSQMHEAGAYSDEYVSDLSILGEELEARGISKARVPVPDGGQHDRQFTYRYEEFPAKLEEEHFEYICKAVQAFGGWLL